jgi:hypothetical protein
MAFGLHFFCSGGYCGCVSLNIFYASFYWLSFSFMRCKFSFWDRVNPAGHHRGMEYFASAILKAVVSSLLFVLADSQKIISPSLSFCMNDIRCTYFDDILFVVLSVAAGICPLPNWSAFEAELSGNLVGPVSGDRIEWRPIGLVLVVLTCRIQMFGVPPSGVLWHPKWIWWHAPHLIWDIWWRYVCVWIWHRWIWEWRCPCRYVRS